MRATRSGGYRPECERDKENAEPARTKSGPVYYFGALWRDD